MGNAEFALKVNKYRELKSDIELLTLELEALTDELKDEMNAREVDSIQVSNFNVIYSKFVTRRFDSRKFKDEQPEMYDQYTRNVAQTRFQIL